MEIVLLCILSFITGLMLGNYIGYRQGGEYVIQLIKDRLKQNNIKDVSK